MSLFISAEEMKANRLREDAELALLAERAIGAWKSGMSMGELANVLGGVGISALSQAWVRHVEHSSEGVKFRQKSNKDD
jgi:hypothetical protein